MNRFVARVIVIVKAAPTWLAFGAAAAPIIAQEAATVLPAPWSDKVTAVLLTVGGVLTAAVTVIRRVTPVAAHERGILPQ